MAAREGRKIVDDPSAHEAERYLELSDEDLFALLVPEEEAGRLYSREGMVARGQQIFRARFRSVRAVVCDVERRRSSSTGNAVDLTVLIAAAMVGSPVALGVPILPFAALVVKIGLNELCRETQPGG